VLVRCEIVFTCEIDGREYKNVRIIRCVVFRSRKINESSQDEEYIVHCSVKPQDLKGL